jgi:hypothetical protein
MSKGSLPVLVNTKRLVTHSPLLILPKSWMAESNEMLGPDLGAGTVLVLLESAKPVIHPLVNNVNNRILSFIFMGLVGF